MFFYSNQRNLGWRFLPVQREPKALITQKQERPLQSEAALGSCRAALTGSVPHERPARDPAASPARELLLPESAGSWQLGVLQLPRTSRVHRGGWGSLSTAKWVWEEGEQWLHRQTASRRRGWLQSRGSFSHYTTCTLRLVSQIAF